MELVLAAFLGCIEGLTEFIPVSSTGHLILLVDLLRFKGPEGHVFEVAIQLGAILAICFAYRHKLYHTVKDLPRSREAQGFALAIIAAFLPAMVLGLMFHKIIKEVLFSPWVVSVALVLGGIFILFIERRVLTPTVHKVEQITFPTALKVGLCQSLAMIPGVSRSGATIIGGCLLGLDRRVATEFSFFLAIPTMFAATVYDLYKNWGSLVTEDFAVIGVGFVSAFISAMLVVRLLVAFVSRNGFSIFGWYRIVVGTIMLGILFVQG